jgi:ribose transport system ATP-binding protein
VAVGEAALALEDVSMVFGDLYALREVSLEVMPGQIHGLIGANGSGKSTLVKIVSGVQAPTSGSILCAGERHSGLVPPARANALGVRVVHQEAPLIDTLTVLESVAIFRGYERGAFGNVRWRRLRRLTRDLLERMDVHVDVDTLCANVRPADRAGLALAIAMGDQFAEGGDQDSIRLLVVDEVTAAIPDSETLQHLERLRLIADSGVAVMMVTHRMAELDFADDLTILRNGRVVYRQGKEARRTVPELVAEMVPESEAVPGAPSTNGDAEAAPSRRPVLSLWESAAPIEEGQAESEAGVEVLSLEGIVGEELRGVSLTARSGEVIGFAGVQHAGINELPLVLSGSIQRAGGTIVVGGKRMRKRVVPAELIGAGLTTVPSDRLREGGVASLSVAENVILPDLRKYWHKRATYRAVVDGVIDSLDVRPPRRTAALGELSGGNQQKVLLGKWLALRPAVLCLDDPTYGVDPSAREIIFEAITDAARLGVCVLFFSTEPEQLVRLCNRVLILEQGEVANELKGDDLNLQTLTESHAK